MRTIYFTILCLCLNTIWAQTLTTSNLPIIKIDTDGDEIPDEPKLLATMGIIDNSSGLLNNVTDPFTDYDGNIGIEVRGNSTAGFEKVSYSVELRTPDNQDTSVALLDMPKEEDWILHAMHIDKTLLRIPMSFYFMQEMGHYASRWQFVELMINDEYRGVYILTEKIKRDKNRVDIAKLKPEDTEGAERTGGYILRIDWLDEELDDNYGFASDYNAMAGEPMFFQWYYPKSTVIQPEQKEYIQGYMKEFEDALFSSTKYNSLGKHYSQYIYLTSFADFIIINELSRNSDGYKLSSYVHKEKAGKGNKLKAGPMWDFDQTYGVSLVCGCNDFEGWNYTQEHDECEDFESMPMWYDALMNDPLFQNHIKCRWEEHRAGHLHKDSIYQWIDDHATLISAAKDRNFTKWDIIGESIWIEPEPVPETYEEEISVMKQWISDRLDWLDANMPGTCSEDIVGQLEETSLDFNLYPNPSHNSVTIDLPVFYEGMKYRIFDSGGRIARMSEVESATFSVDIGELESGVYTVELFSMLGITRKRLIKY